MKDQIINEIRENISVNKSVIEKCVDSIELAANVMASAIKSGNKILWCGNGGSAGNAIHLANDFLYGVSSHVKASGLRVEALSANSAVVTCLANDIGYDEVFAEQIRVKGNSGDILIVLSGSGNSENVVRAIQKANSMGAYTIGLLGNNGGKLKEIVNLPIVIPSNDTARIQEVHITIGHIICEIIEEDF